MIKYRDKIDRTNVSIAAVQMNRDLHLSATAYGFGAGIFFLAYALCRMTLFER